MAFQTPHNLVISDEQLDMSAKKAVLSIGTFSGFNHENFSRYCPSPNDKGAVALFKISQSDVALPVPAYAFFINQSSKICALTAPDMHQNAQAAGI